jgi:hypothetical protein
MSGLGAREMTGMLVGLPEAVIVHHFKGTSSSSCPWRTRMRGYVSTREDDGKEMRTGV